MRRRARAILAALWLALVALAAHAQAQFGGGQTIYDRPGDPPRVAAKLFFEYRHLQAYSEEYNKWVADNILPLRYDTVPGAYLSRWDDVTRAAARTEVVLVTQSTVSRLLAVQMVAREWKGPITVAIYIELPAADADAATCRGRVTAWLRERVVEAWPGGAAHAPPLAVSYLHANERAANASCELPGPDAFGGGEVGAPRGRSAKQAPPGKRDGVGGRKRKAAARFGQTTVPQYLLHRFDAVRLGRRLRGAENSAAAALAGDAGRGLAAQAEHSPAGLKPVWHAQPSRPGAYITPTERPWRDVYASFYPVNALRNLAWSQVPAGAFVFLSDVDFVPTPDLHSDLTAGKWVSELEDMRDSYERREERRVLVVPAFERLEAAPDDRSGSLVVPYKAPCLKSEGCAVIQGFKVPRSFGMLRTMLQRAAVGVFHRKKFAPGHGCYSWLTWFQDAAPAKMVKMEYRHQCEPYVIALSDAMPRYDERFRGRGYNKIEQLTHMAAWGFQWKLLPAHFVLHIPHEKTATQAEGNWDVETTPLALMNVEMREIEREPQFRQHVQLDIPSPIGTH